MSHMSVAGLSEFLKEFDLATRSFPIRPLDFLYLKRLVYLLQSAYSTLHWQSTYRSHLA